MTEPNTARTAINPVTWSVGMGFNQGEFQHYDVLASRLGAAGVAPTTTMLGVTRLAIPDLMVELEGTAVA